MPTMERNDGERERCGTGIEAIDHILNGGIPRGNTVLISGSVGTGKTSICIEFLIRGALNNENSLYLSVTEPTDKLLKNVIPFDFFDDRLMKQGKLQFIDLPNVYAELGIDKEDMDTQSTRLLVDSIAGQVEEQKIRRLVLDSVTSVCYRIKDQERIRDFLLRLGTVLSAKGCTSLLVSEIRSSEEGYSRWAVEAALADGVGEHDAAEGRSVLRHDPGDARSLRGEEGARGRLRHLDDPEPEHHRRPRDPRDPAGAHLVRRLHQSDHDGPGEAPPARNRRREP